MRFFAFTTTSTLLLLATANLGSAWTQQMNPTSTTSVAASNAKLSATASTRRDVLFGMASTTVSSIFLWMENAKPARAAETLANGVSYEIMKSGSGPKPQVGELVAIRFAAYCGDTKIDDIFDTPEPYYTRIGSGGLLKGVEETLPLMQVGDRWKLTIPVCFEEKKRLYGLFKG